MFLERLEDVYVYNACIYKAGVYSAREEFLFYENGWKKVDFLYN